MADPEKPAQSDQDVKDLAAYKIKGDGWDSYWLDHRTGKIQADFDGGHYRSAADQYTIHDFAKALSIINADPKRPGVAKNVIEDLNLETTNALLKQGGQGQEDSLWLLLGRHAKDIEKKMDESHKADKPNDGAMRDGPPNPMQVALEQYKNTPAGTGGGDAFGLPQNTTRSSERGGKV